MLSDVLRRAGQTFRSQDWWFYKIPPLLAAGYAQALACPPLPSMIRGMFAALLAICAVASYGYTINDIFDVEQDRRSGKPNRMSRIGLAGRAGLCVALPVAGFLPLYVARVGRVPMLLYGANLLLPTLYSLPGIRLKERGFLGVLADAGAAHTIPTALMLSSVAAYCPKPMGLLMPAIGWATFSGLRGIIAHQVADGPADALAGVETFGGRLGRLRARALTFRWLFPLEILSLLFFFRRILPAAPVVAAALIVWGAGEALKIGSAWKLPLFEEPAVSQERYVPVLNNELYEVWLSIALALQLAQAHVEFVGVFVFQVIAFFPNNRARLRLLGDALVAPEVQSAAPIRGQSKE